MVRKIDWSGILTLLVVGFTTIGYGLSEMSNQALEDLYIVFLLGIAFLIPPIIVLLKYIKQ